jgi:hypothetical protein
MICAVCYGVLRGHQGSQWRGTFDLHFDHHANRRELQKSASMSCCICRSIWFQLSQLEQKWSGAGVWDRIYNTLRRMMWGDVLRIKHLDSKDRSRFISAYLSENYGDGEDDRLNGTYRLDFKLKDTETIGTFVLKHVGEWHSPVSTEFRLMNEKRNWMVRLTHHSPRIHHRTRFSFWLENGLKNVPTATLTALANPPQTNGTLLDCST